MGPPAMFGCALGIAVLVLIGIMILETALGGMG